MNKRLKRSLSIVVVLACLLAGAWVAHSLSQRRETFADQTSFDGTTGITFTRKTKRGHLIDNEVLVVSSPSEIKTFVSKIQLQRKPQCKCGHTNRADFDTPTGRVSVSFCDHCFDVGNGYDIGTNKPRHYWMPQPFHAAFEEIEKRAVWQTELKSE